MCMLTQAVLDVFCAMAASTDQAVRIDALQQLPPSVLARVIECFPPVSHLKSVRSVRA
eukprot:m.140981 g.140981  ORF g.140981 m.140981 type:complete len:58 (+) comp9631_c0_seq17:5535-5708(+)